MTATPIPSACIACLRMPSDAETILPLTLAKGLVVMLATIGYFPSESDLFASRYGDQHSLSAHRIPASPPATAPARADTVARLLRRARLSTPLPSYAKALGQPASAKADGYKAGNMNYLFKPNDGRAVQVSVGPNNRVLAISGYDRASKLPIPTLHVDWIRQHTPVQSWQSLNDVTLGSVLEHCEWKHDSYAQAKMGNFFVGPCYFGRSSSYNKFTFVFLIEDTDPLCAFDVTYNRKKKLDYKWVRDCNASRKKPIGFVVTNNDDQADRLDDNNITRYQAARMSFVDYIIGDGPG